MNFNLLRAWKGTGEEQPSLNGREISDDELTAVVGGFANGEPGEEEEEEGARRNQFVQNGSDITNVGGTLLLQAAAAVHADSAATLP